MALRCCHRLGPRGGLSLSIFYAPDAEINTWKITLVDLASSRKGCRCASKRDLHIGAAIMLTVFTIQHRGILGTARIQTILTVSDAVAALPRLHRAAVDGRRGVRKFIAVHGRCQRRTGHLIPGAGTRVTWLLFLVWPLHRRLVYLCLRERPSCYMSEYKNPGEDMWRAIIYSGLFCIAAYILIPIMFQGVLGTNG
jgi:hypothetical protein